MDIFATSSTLEMRCKHFFSINPMGQWVGKLGILGKNLGVKASLRYIRIRGITWRVLTRLTCTQKSTKAIKLHRKTRHHERYAMHHSQRLKVKSFLCITKKPTEVSLIRLHEIFF